MRTKEKWDLQGDSNERQLIMDVACGQKLQGTHKHTILCICLCKEELYKDPSDSSSEYTNFPFVIPLFDYADELR